MVMRLRFIGMTRSVNRIASAFRVMAQPCTVNGVGIHMLSLPIIVMGLASRLMALAVKWKSRISVVTTQAIRLKGLVSNRMDRIIIRMTMAIIVAAQAVQVDGQGHPDDVPGQPNEDEARHSDGSGNPIEVPGHPHEWRPRLFAFSMSY